MSASDPDSKAPSFRAWRALLPRFDRSGNPLPKEPGFVVDQGPSAHGPGAGLPREFPADLLGELHDYLLLDASGGVEKPLVPSVWSVEDDLGATVFSVSDSVLLETQVTLRYPPPIRIERREGVLADTLREVAPEDRETVEFLSRAIQRWRESLASERAREERAGEERVAAIPGAEDDYKLGEDFRKAQHALYAHIYAYESALYSGLLRILVRFGMLARSLRTAHGEESAPRMFLCAVDACAIGCRVAAFDRTVGKRDLPTDVEAGKLPAWTASVAREIESALAAAERELLENAERQEWVDALANASGFRAAAQYVSRSRELLVRSVP